MRILIVAPMAPLADGPGAIPVLLNAQLEALTGRHEVTLVAGVGDEPWERAAAAAIREGVGVHLVDRRSPTETGARTRRRVSLASRWVSGRRPWRSLWFAPPAVQSALDHLASRRTFDLVVVEDAAMASLRLPPQTPRLLTEHEVGRAAFTTAPLDSVRALPSSLLSHVDWRRWEPYQARAWRRFDRVQVFTEHDARAVRARAPELDGRIRVNPFGLVLPRPVDPAEEDPGVVLFTGNFTHPPNRDAAQWLAAEIMPRVRGQHPQARLLLVGTAPPQEISSLAIDDQVSVVADAPDLDAYLARAAVCVAPVRLGGGMRMKVLYALASGKAVVSTSLGAEGYIREGEEAPMLIADDAEGIAAGVARLLTDATVRHELRRRAIEFAHRFHSPEAWGRRLDAVYEEALAALPPVAARV